MKSLTAGLAMRSKRPDTFLIIQLPRRSSDSQPYTDGTFGHFSMPRMTISSMPSVWKIARNPSIAAASPGRSSAMLSAVAGFAYGFHEPSTKPYGGSALGYALGTVAALLVLWLLWFGVRKRLYRSTLGSVQGWLSAHVYLGTALL